MLCRTPIFALLATAMTFAVRGANNITVTGSVDSRIDSVTLMARRSTGEGQQFVVSANQTGTTDWWEADTAYTAVVTRVSVGYTPRWSVTKSGMAELSGGTNDTITLSTAYSGCTLSFYGEPNTYRVDFDRQSGSGGTSSVTATYDAAMPTATMPTRTGYSFGGYYTETGGGGTQYYNDDGSSAQTWNIPSNTTLYAKWTANSYTVTLDQQSGSGGTESVTATYDAPLPAISVPTREGYVFGGYYEGQGGSGTQYYTAAGASAHAWSVAAPTTLYAKWTAQTCTVTLDRQNGSGGTASVTATYGMTLPGITRPSREGYEFGGYFTGTGGSGTQYYTAIGTPSTAYFTDDTTLYACWILTEQHYRVSFDANGGTGGSYQDFTMNQSAPLPPFSSLYIRNPVGYTFSAWNTAEDGSGTTYNDEAIIYNLTNVANAVVTLYAQWAPNPYEVAFHPNGADGGETMDNQSFVYDVTQHLAAVEFTYTGRAFERWSSDTNYNYQTKYYADGAEVVNLTALSNDVVNLYANWTGIVYTVSFDANGGTGAMAPVPCTYNVPTNLPACAFTRDGWGFKNWTNAVGEAFVDRARVTNLTATAGADVALFACWTGVTYAVTLDASRDSRGIGLMTNDMGEAVSVFTTSAVVGDAWNLPVPTNVNENLTFAGWRYGDGQTASGEVPPPSSGSTNLVAAWAWVTDDLAAAVDAPELGFRTFATVGRLGKPSDTPYSANWFAEANQFFDDGVSTNAVQSGALPVNTGDGLVYVSWLTAKVDGKGVLSFRWKCDALPVKSSQYAAGGWAGDSLRFGLYDATEGITNEIERLTNHVDWCQVVYTNEFETAVSFAWAFVYADDGYDNGGGTGWVDRVTWTPEGAAVDVTPTHGVPYSWLRETFGLGSASDAELEAKAEDDSPNGKAWPDGTSVKVWEDYWAGTDPNNADDIFHVLIEMNNSVPSITPCPDMSTGTPARVYNVLCAPTPSAQYWELVRWPPDPSDPALATNRFFKVELDVEGSR